MARKPMSEEAKQNLRDKALARAATKKAGTENVSPTPIEDLAPGVESTQESGPARAVDLAKDPMKQAGKEAIDEPEKAQPKDYADHLTSVQEAREEIKAIQHRYPDMIEAKQAADALENAIYFMGRVQSTLESK